jgi:hypothetical protein
MYVLKSPFYILVYIFILVYASPQHEYTPLKKEEIYSDDVTCSDATIYCTSDYTSKILYQYNIIYIKKNTENYNLYFLHMNKTHI